MKMDFVKLWLICMIEYRGAIAMEYISILVNQNKHSNKSQLQTGKHDPDFEENIGVCPWENHLEGFTPKHLHFLGGGGILSDFNLSFFLLCMSYNEYVFHLEHVKTC